MCKKQQLLSLYKAFYQSIDKVQFLQNNKTLIQNYNINFANVLASIASLLKNTFYIHQQ